ncbi:hypothetical protein ZYGR_0AD05190 [Zygosaccharomyces rouxii]|uniref:Kinetochore-associated protein n=2 Tax=Zygosaccharomyces rouxii TaxID=4956 RepID=C5E147_ZYGRC|nr:uncharacterized protein ZYRO0G18018g [Zygosaccharomyces rouxii]KAH9202824.1 Nnf1-domain-containing protein [Zygosaccharomyces rouxii]GAV51336.1 hypothetical protein ZYGR_0AD05190 [Zygosaccharomyces rouxii]CAR29831.1 ZYRO0G18018p [Zygosaccharomyces rouxii]
MTKDDKIRYLRLNQVFHKALTQSISKLQNWDIVSSCFPDYASTREGSTNLSNCQAQVIEFWTEICRREFEEILRERNVKVKLDELDELILEARERLRTLPRDEKGNHAKSTPIDELSSSKLIECNLYSQRLQTMEQLDQRLHKLNRVNRDLDKELQELESSIDSDRKDLSQLYDRYVGQTVNNPLDETLVQGLNDMLLELREEL